MLTFTGSHFEHDGEPLSVIVTRKRGRYQYRDSVTGKLLASGCTPEEFARRYWYATLTPSP